MGPPTQGPPPTTGVTSPKESEVAVHMDVSATEPQEEARQLPDGRGTSLVVEETADAVSTPTAADGNGVRCPCGFNEVRPAQHNSLECLECWECWHLAGLPAKRSPVAVATSTSGGGMRGALGLPSFHTGMPHFH